MVSGQTAHGLTLKAKGIPRRQQHAGLCKDCEAIIHQLERTGSYLYLMLYRMKCCCTRSSWMTVSYIAGIGLSYSALNFAFVSVTVGGLNVAAHERGQ